MWQIRFLGVANGGELGTSAAVLQRDDQPVLLIDCGFDTLRRYLDCYGAGSADQPPLPPAIYISHLHLDHIGDLETLFYKACFMQPRPAIKLFVASHLVHHLTQRVGNYPGQIAEGGVNFWDVIQLVPVLDGFWWQQHYFRIYPTRHHQPNSSFALHLPGVFFFSGDTRPIPEILHHYCAQGETLLHDCGLHGNPSHSGAGDLFAEYEPHVFPRLVAYHYHSPQQAHCLEAMGIRIARVGEVMALSASGRSALDRATDCC